MAIQIFGRRKRSSKAKGQTPRAQGQVTCGRKGEKPKIRLRGNWGRWLVARIKSGRDRGGGGWGK